MEKNEILKIFRGFYLTRFYWGFVLIAISIALFLKYSNINDIFSFSKFLSLETLIILVIVYFVLLLRPQWLAILLFFAIIIQLITNSFRGWIWHIVSFIFMLIGVGLISDNKSYNTTDDNQQQQYTPYEEIKD